MKFYLEKSLSKKKKVKNKPLIIICGPTAVGKTETAVRLAEKIGEIISADSMQIYKYLNIGTSKPNSDLLKKVKHHLIDIINPDQDFSAYQFKTMAENIIKNLYEKKVLPFVVGGNKL
jgi:tRNA dimethylallyltransferase